MVATGFELCYACQLMGTGLLEVAAVLEPRWGLLGPQRPGNLAFLPRCQMCLCVQHPLGTHGDETFTLHEARVPQSFTRSHASHLTELFAGKSCPSVSFPFNQHM